MESSNTDIEELHKEGLRQRILKQIGYTPSTDLQNVPNFDFDNLFSSSCSVIQGTGRYVPAKRRDSGDFFGLGTRHDVNYHKIIIEKCSKNRGCMCTSVKDDTVDSEEEKIDNKKTIPPSEPHVTPPIQTKTKSIENQTSKQSTTVNTTPVQTEISLINDSDDITAKSRKKTQTAIHKRSRKKENTSSSSASSKYCVPLNIEKIIIGQSRSRRCCSCQTHDSSTTWDQKLPRNGIYEKKLPQVHSRQKESMKKFPSTDGKMTESSSCSCDRKKRKYFYFKKKPGKILNTADSEKIIQTIEPDYADKADQTSSKQNLVHASTSDSKVTTNNDTQVKMITVCSKCGKISDSHCKRCCKACTKNTIVLPPKPLISGDQADTLKTLIKMEAKQNYRQVNIILQELNDQKSEIKKLIDLYQGLSKNVSGNKLDKTSSTAAKKRDYAEDSPFQRPQTVNICEGCGLHFYRTSLLEHVRSERCEPRPAVTTGKVLSDEQQATQDADSNKKYPKRNKSKTSKDQANIQVVKTSKNTLVKGKTIDENAEYVDNEKDARPLKRTDSSLLTLYQGEKSRASEASTFTEQPPAELQIPSIKPEKPTSNTATQYEKYYTEYERIGTSKTDTEKSSKIAENPLDEKPADQCQTRSKAFLRWWKKSCISLKERESKHIKQCSKYMMEKIEKKVKECRKNKRPQKSFFTYFVEYFKKKRQAVPVKQHK